ncbi:hypothetical protein M406DRAFT_354867 [Cryphonectria parasitica EP155]|uniref:Uncharacterized protein n=1 Tax=Cryphonectria parasitica (strain ATCC 38755 / EP155) TaxID=660469 RepID=A0A9P4Y810_CRYP1|nr:uncharacterized protein M406DRAFT_354867 [Cryphonectria parasitica EP155]KAF3768233.1 hypothetical protein M406DRAFT_354867 [Cryphonectria parasitica EP155]
MSSRNNPNDLLNGYTGPLPSMQGQDLLNSNRHNVLLPSMQPQDPIRRFIENHTNSYNTGRNTFTFSRDAARDGSGSVNLLDGNCQLRAERSHDRNWSSRATVSSDRVTLASGSANVIRSSGSGTPRAQASRGSIRLSTTTMSAATLRRVSRTTTGGSVLSFGGQ